MKFYFLFMIMKKYFTLSLATIALGLSACTTINSSVQNNTQSSMSSIDYMSVVSSSSAGADMKDLYRYYESKELGLSFYYPAKYDAIRTEINVKKETNDSPILYSYVSVWEDTGGESPGLSIEKTSDARILQDLAHDNPLQVVTVNGIKMQKFQLKGMGDSEGFVEKKNNEYIVIEFSFAPTEEIMSRIVSSIKFY
jgi:hypothetical protein